MKKHVTFAALMSMLTCAACAEKPAQSAFVAGAPVQYSAVAWEQMASSGEIARVHNQRLIFQR